MFRTWTLIIVCMALALVSCNGDDGGTGPGTDTTDPSVSFVQPTQGSTVTAGAVLVRAQATDDVAIAKVEFYVDGAKVGEDATGSSNVFEYTWNTVGLANGSAHTLKARAIDTSDNDKEVTITVTICPCPAGPTYHSTSIRSNETWYACCGPHIVTEDIGIENGATLTIAPGCVVKVARDKGFLCGWSPDTGSIVAVGKPDSTILFTSNEATPAAGDWRGFSFWEGTLSTARFSYCTIQYAGAAGEQAIWLDFGGTLKMDHTTLRYSAGKGISYDRFGHLAQFNNNTITGCADYPLELEPEYIRELGTGNSFTGNAAGKNVVRVNQGGVETSGTWQDQGVPYQVPEGQGIGIGSQTGTAVVTIAPGTVIQFGLDAYLHVGYTVSAGLIAEGTVAKPIYFTSAQDSPQPGDWRHIYISGSAVDAQCRFSHCVIEYGGGSGATESIAIEEAVPSITNCEINYSGGWGISMTGLEHPNQAALESQNSFTGNASGDVTIY